MKNELLDDTSKTPIWYWIVAGIALLWNLMGLGAYVAQSMMTAEDMAAMDAAQRALYENFPMWANIAFAIAVIAGTLGSIGLLVRKKWALPVLGLSLIGVIVHMIHNISSGAINFSQPASAIMPAMIFIIALALIGFAKNGIGKNLIR